MRTAEYTLELADRAARRTMGSNWLWTHEDWEDAIQEAALTIVRLPPDAHEGYCVKAGKHAIYEWMRRWLRHPGGAQYCEYIDYSLPPDDPPPSLDYLDALPPLLKAQRAEKVEEDMAYLRLRLQGYNTAGIAQELGITHRNVEAIHERIIPRLERIARGEGPPPWKVNLHANSRATLDRINSDPEALARRAEAIRAGWARRKQALATRRSAP